MLKIKDNVDLKELEKFGFLLGEYISHYYKYLGQDRRGASCTLEIDDNKCLTICFGGQDTGDDGVDYLDDVIYDLIKADLVEKV